MLATLVDAPFQLPGWVFEEKYDGIRILAYKEGARVELLSRNMKDRTADFEDVADALRKLRAPSLALDGELVMFDREEVSRFQLLQRRELRSADTVPVLAVFDCLYARGRDLRAQPLADRRAVLEKEVQNGGALLIARRLDGDGFRAFEDASRLGLEGIVGKDLAAPYVAGVRSPAWRKVKIRHEDEFVIGGYTAPGGSRTHFGSLLLGTYAAGKLLYAGKVGSGFTAQSLSGLMKRFTPLIRAESPFHDHRRERDVTWLEPVLIAQLAYTELTGDGRLRHPVFLGLRDDKPARDVRLPRR